MLAVGDKRKVGNTCLCAEESANAGDVANRNVMSVTLDIKSAHQLPCNGVGHHAHIISTPPLSVRLQSRHSTCVIALLEQRRVSSRLSYGGQLFFTLCTCTKRAEKGITAIPTILLSTGVMHSAYGSGTKLMAKPTPNKNLGHIHSLTEARLASIR